MSLNTTAFIDNFNHRFKTLPFYLEKEQYKIDEFYIEKNRAYFDEELTNEINKYNDHGIENLSEIKNPDFKWSPAMYDYEDTPDHAKLQKLRMDNLNCIKEFCDKYETFIANLKNVSINKTDFQEYLNSKKESDSIKQYNQLKDRFKIDIRDMLETNDNIWMLIRSRHDTTINTLTDYTKETENPLSESNKSYVLNRHNPFADVSIQNQQFLYPSDDQVFKTLNFNIGYTLSKQEYNDNQNIVLTPNFKISKTNDRFLTDNNIQIDDTLSTPIKEQKNTVEKFYI